MNTDDWTHQYVVVNGVRLHYVESGSSGPLVILLHGFPEFWYSWRHQIPVLAAAGFRVIALDQRGYNTSGKPKGVRHYRIDVLVDDVLGIIHQAGEQSAVIVGHDWGGAVGWMFAMRYPQVVEKLIILNAPHPQRFIEEVQTLSQLRRSWYIFLFQLPWLPEALFRAGDYARLEVVLRRDPVHEGVFDAISLQEYKRAIAQPGALTAAINYYRALFWCNPLRLKRAICRIETPTVLIWGEKDRYLGVRLTEGLDPWVPNLKLELIPDASHWVQVEVPERVNELMCKFLRTTNPPVADL